MNKQELMQNIVAARQALADAETALSEWADKAENNVFATMADAEGAIEEALLSRASADCEGSYNCGDSEYRRQFIVDGKTYVGVLTVEYNRHDKTYYYVDEYDFKVEDFAAA